MPVKEKFGKRAHSPVKRKNVRTFGSAIATKSWKKQHSRLARRAFFQTQALNEKMLLKRLLEEIDPNGCEVKALCKDFGLKHEELGRLTGFSARDLAAWAVKELPSEPAQRRLRELRRLRDALCEMVHAPTIPEWLHNRNPAFNNMTPLQVIEMGEIDRIWGMIHQIGGGMPE